MARPYGKAIWQCHMAMPYGNAIWPCHMAEPYGKAIWPCHMAAAAAAAAPMFLIVTENFSRNFTPEKVTCQIFKMHNSDSENEKSITRNKK